MTEYVGWLGLDRSSLDQKDVLAGGIERLNLATPGFLSKAEGATTTVAPLLHTSPQAMQIAAEKFSAAPDPVGLLRAYKPEGKALTLAARISGTANSAYPEGAPKPVPKAEDGDKPKDAAAAAKPEDKAKEAVAEATDDIVEAAKTCKAQKADDAATFEATFGTKKNAFGKCVSAEAKKQGDES